MYKPLRHQQFNSPQGGKGGEPPDIKESKETSNYDFVIITAQEVVGKIEQERETSAKVDEDGAYANIIPVGSEQAILGVVPALDPDTSIANHHELISQPNRYQGLRLSLAESLKKESGLLVMAGPISFSEEEIIDPTRFRKLLKDTSGDSVSIPNSPKDALHDSFIDTARILIAGGANPKKPISIDAFIQRNCKLFDPPQKMLSPKPTLGKLAGFQLKRDLG